MKKIISFVIWILLPLLAFPQFSVSLQIKNCNYTTAHFCKIQSQKVIVLQTQKIEKGKVQFSLLQKPETGIYRIHFKDTAFVDMIVDRDQEIIMQSQFPSLIDSMKVLKGEDNQNYYNYLQFKNRKLSLLAFNAAKIKAAYSGKKAQIDAQGRIEFLKGSITTQIEAFAFEIWKKDTSLFASKIIRAMVIPNMDMYMMEHPEGKMYHNDVEFLMEHFFDNISFTDSSFVNSEFYFRTIRYYFEKLVQPRNSEGFQYANDFILNKAKHSKAVLRELISIMCSLYEETQLESVYVNLFDTYITKDPSILDAARFSKTSERVNIIKMLQPGTVVQNISGTDTTGKTMQLSDANGKYTLLFFWTANKKCSDAITRLKDLDTTYRSLGFRVYGYCTDSTTAKWKQALRQVKPGWPNVIKTQSITAPVEKMFNTWSLPSMYLLNNERKIVFRPMNVDYLQKKLKEIYGK
ncbi:MAG: TlpA disulfide reductase family protein [Bacteroidota bacterium]